MAIGRSAERLRVNSAAPMRRTCSSVSRYVIVRQLPAASRSAMNARSGASRAQCTKRSVNLAG
jgi:hypothetical protein